MHTVAGVFARRGDAERAAAGLVEIGIPRERITLLAPGTEARRVPTDEGEAPGIGATLGAIIGGASGAVVGLPLGAVVTLLVPGVGAVIVAGVIGAAAGRRRGRRRRRTRGLAGDGAAPRRAVRLRGRAAPWPRRGGGVGGRRRASGPRAADPGHHGGGDDRRRVSAGGSGCATRSGRDTPPSTLRPSAKAGRAARGTGASSTRGPASRRVPDEDPRARNSAASLPGDVIVGGNAR